MIDLKGKTVLVTGGSRGIGEAIVRAVAAAGGDVLLHYGKSRAAAEAVQKDVRPATCRLLQADLGEADAPAALWRAATTAATRIDVVVNNAGIFEPITVEASSEA
ncbi:MAG TPA: SDR family NAD(P)-dependent oxidoreductase, partial [Dongiaceae bacterium]|nr:SDR family NAD(P)-dependent oxidoreductase [Dongiaceae bacterium]